MWRKVLSWEVEQDIARNINEFLNLAKLGQIWETTRGKKRYVYVMYPPSMSSQDLGWGKIPAVKGIIWGDNLKDPPAKQNKKWMSELTKEDFPLKLIKEGNILYGSSLQLTSFQQLTAENITNKQIEPGDYVTPDQTYTTSNTKKVVFTEGKEYVVTGYPTFTVGLYVQSDLGEWTISFRENGLADHFSWRKPTNEEQKQTTLENNPFITDILNIITTSGSYPMTVEQITDKVLQLYISEGGKMPSKEFQTKMSVAWGDAFHLGFVAMVRRSDKVAITPEGRHYLQG